MDKNDLIQTDSNTHLLYTNYRYMRCIISVCFKVKQTDYALNICHTEAEKVQPNAANSKWEVQWLKFYSGSRQHKEQENTRAGSRRDMTPQRLNLRHDLNPN